jgi:hypothetical protein
MSPLVLRKKASLTQNTLDIGASRRNFLAPSGEMPHNPREGQFGEERLMTYSQEIFKAVFAVLFMNGAATSSFAEFSPHGNGPWRASTTDVRFATYINDGIPEPSSVTLLLIGCTAVLWILKNSRFRRTNVLRRVLFGVVLTAGASASAADTVMIDFEEIARPRQTTPPEKASYGEGGYNPFSSQGYVFWNPGPDPGQLYLVDRDYELNPLHTGSDYLEVQNPAWLNIRRDLGPFRLESFEVGLVGFAPPREAAIFMLGWRNDGEILQATFDAPRRQFSPVTPGREWTQLNEVWFRSINFVGYDNFTLVAVPEPTTLGLIVLPGLALLILGLGKLVCRALHRAPKSAARRVSRRFLCSFR